jgi:hypothetical protein
MTGPPGTVYLLHLDALLGHARHYTGITGDSRELEPLEAVESVCFFERARRVSPRCRKQGSNQPLVPSSAPTHAGFPECVGARDPGRVR